MMMGGGGEEEEYDPSKVGNKVASMMYAAAKDHEEYMDDENARLDKLMNNKDELEELRRKRMESMKLEHRAKGESLAKGGGTYTELKEEKDFFDEAKKFKWMVAVFVRGTDLNTDVMTKHMQSLAKTYWGTRFICVSGEKAPYLCEKLHIWMLPSIVLIKEGRTEYTIRGFDELGGMDFPTERLEAVLAFREVIPPLEDGCSRLD